MNVGMIGIEGDFDKPDVSRATKRSVNRYMYQLRSAMLGLKIGGLDLSTIEVPKLRAGSGFSVMLGTLMKNLSGYDILHNMDLWPFFPQKKGNALVISTVQSFEFLFDVEKDIDTSSIRGIMRHKIVIPIAFNSLRRSDYLIAISSITKDDAVKWGYEVNRIFVVNHGIDKKYTTTRSATHAGRKKFVIGYIGTFRQRKNLGMAIEAVKNIKNSNVLFEIWGKKMFQYERFARMASSDRRTVFMGPAPEERIVQTYDSFDAFLFPTTYEGFGFPILEAQSRGLPVIIYKYGKIPKEVRKYCLEADSAGQMAQLIERIKENGFNDKLRKKEIEYARSFTWERCARNTYNVYKRVLG